MLIHSGYGNIASISLSKVATPSIQSIITTTARLITGVRKYDNVTSVLKKLHWLESERRIEYKIALQVYKCLSNESLAYLTRDIIPVVSLPEKQRLRLAKSKDVASNKHKLKSLGFAFTYLTIIFVPSLKFVHSSQLKLFHF